MHFLTPQQVRSRPRLGFRVLLLVFAVLAFSGATQQSVAQEPAPVLNGEPTERPPSEFLAALSADFSLPEPDDEVGWRLLADYGAVLVARGGATPPSVLVFPDEQAVSSWQASVATNRTKVGKFAIELQAPALEALLAAQAEAGRRRLTITPRGRDAARRRYADTVRLWLNRVHTGLNHWVRKGRLTRQEAARIRALSPWIQAAEILRLEKQGINFGRGFSKSILYSKSAPGASQHLSMLALDVREHDNPTVRTILARHGWFQTVVSDLPHFTYLGVEEQQLPFLGLKKVTSGGRRCWVPDFHWPVAGESQKRNSGPANGSRLP